MAIKHYVEWFYAGSFCSDTGEEEVKSRDPESVPDNPRAYAFRFLDRAVGEVEGEVVYGAARKISGKYYLRGRIHTIEMIEAEMPNSILHQNMKWNKWDRVIECAQGYLPFHEGDILK